MIIYNDSIITGTMVAYYTYCPRRCWLFAHHLQMEQNSNYVEIGRFYHDEFHQRNKNRKEISMPGFKIDEVEGKYIIELKKSKSDIQAAKYQLLFYLYQLHKMGIDKIGILKFKENKGQQKIVLTNENKKEIENILSEINSLITGPVPPVVKTKRCAKCSYYKFCFA